MTEHLINPEWPFSCRGAVPIDSDPAGNSVQEFDYDGNLQLNVSRSTGRPVVNEEVVLQDHGTTYKTAVQKEGDQPDFQLASSRATYTSSMTKADKEGDQPDPDNASVCFSWTSRILAATSLQTEVSKEQDRPDR